MRNALRLAALGSVSIALVATPVSAQSSDADTIAALRAQIDALTKRVNDLEKAGLSASLPDAQTQAPVANVSPPPLPADGKPPNGSGLRVALAPIDRPLQPLGGAFQLSASNDSTNVAIRLGTAISRPNLSGRSTGTAAYHTLSATASAPFDKKTKQGSLGTLDNFANSSTLKLRWTGFFIPIANPRIDPVTAARDREIIETARRNCRAKSKPDEQKACNGDYDHAFIEKWATELADEYYRLGFPASPSFALGLEGSVGYKKYTYLNAATLEEKEQERVPLGVKGFATLFPDASLSALTASLEYQRGFKEQKSAVLCPASTGGPVRCVEGAVGEPKRQDSLLAALEFRTQWTPKDSWIRSVGIAPQLTHDLIKDESGFDLPIYVVPDAKGGLIGGLRFGYTTKEDDFVVGVFVGSAFSFRQ